MDTLTIQSPNSQRPEKNDTPLMRQYWDIKSAHMDKVLLFRMGDFFEMFHSDALTAAPILGIALTKRNQKGNDETPMCGVPHHSIAGPINKLLAASFRVAICDQAEDPRFAKGIVKRKVTRILSPGMVYDVDTLDSQVPNYMASLSKEGEEYAVSFLDGSTGEGFFLNAKTLTKVRELIGSLNPRELVLTETQASELRAEMASENRLISIVSDVGSVPAPAAIAEGAPASAKRLVAYAVSLQGEEILKTLRPFEARHSQKCLDFGRVSLKQLEVFETYRGERRGSLLHAIDRTKTAAGARRLRTRIAFPLTDVGDIEARLDGVESWTKKPELLKEIRAVLAGMGDIERRLGRLSTPGCNGRDLIALGQSLQAGYEVSAMSGDRESARAAHHVANLIERTIVSLPPLSIKEGGFVNKGFSPDLDELIELTTDTTAKLLEMEAREREATGIGSLKIKYNNVFGYFIEITNTHKAKAPARYMRKQTLATAERFITDELSEMETKILSAKTKRADLEFEIFESLRKEVLSSSRELLTLALQWAELDVTTALAWLALERNYVRPRFNKTGDISIIGSRHPVIEQSLSEPFVPNDIHMKKGEALVLTGPNMAGKSTLMRQVALTSILAQAGAFVPAASGSLPIFKEVFTRIGASDNLSEGESTFMVEMKETAQMLDEAGPDSMIILDEIGRGTSTYDGMSLAQAILEFILEKTGAMTLFATHYHELTRLEEIFEKLKNAHMAIQEKGGRISFLHSLTPGPANKSYGIHVGELAGLPKHVTQRAKEVLKRHESGAASPSLRPQPQLSFFDAALTQADSPEVQLMREFTGEVQDFQVNEKTPLEALAQISAWKKKLKL